MKERLRAFREVLTRSRRIGFFDRIENHLRTLSPSDKLIASILGVAIVVLACISLYSVERMFLVEVPSHGGSLTEGVLGSPRFVNPLLALTDADRDLVTLTYAGLMGYSKSGDIVPVLASDYAVSEDGKTYTFTLRENARFSDGSPVTAEDVVFTVEKAQDPTLKSPELSNWSNILVEAVDARTVRFTLPKAYAPFLTDATLGILPMHIWKDIPNAQFPFAPQMTEPIGAGPFSVTHIVRTKTGMIERYELHAFKDYALGKPYLSKITLMFFQEEAELQNALARGRVESAHSVTGDNARTTSYARVFGVFFNQNQNPLFARLEVRKALSQAFDRTVLVENELGGYATPIYGPVPLGSEASSDSAPYETGRVAAEETLNKNGWSFDEEAQVWKQEKENLELRVTIKTANVPELRVVAEAVQKDWGALGVPVSVEYYESSELAQEVIRPRKYDALLFGMVLGRDRDLFAFWESSQRNDPGLNIAMYANKRVDDLLEAIRVETDADILSESLREVNTLIAADYPAVFTHAPFFVYHVPKEMRGVYLGNISSPSDRFLTIAFWYRNTEWVWPFLVGR